MPHQGKSKTSTVFEAAYGIIAFVELGWSVGDGDESNHDEVWIGFVLGFLPEEKTQSLQYSNQQEHSQGTVIPLSKIVGLA